MKNRVRPIALIATALMPLAASGVRAAGTDARRLVEGLNKTWDQAFNSGNAAALASLYDEKATVSPGNGKALVGRAEIEKLFKSFFDMGFTNHGIEVIEAHEHGGLAYEIARWSAQGPEKDGKRPTYNGVLVNVFRKGTDGKWMSVSHLWNAASG